MASASSSSARSPSSSSSHSGKKGGGGGRHPPRQRSRSDGGSQPAWRLAAGGRMEVAQGVYRLAIGLGRHCRAAPRRSARVVRIWMAPRLRWLRERREARLEWAQVAGLERC
eukprot:scaffold36274_cov125-Isochrysis_galbana.AAC.20